MFGQRKAGCTRVAARRTCCRLLLPFCGLVSAACSASSSSSSDSVKARSVRSVEQVRGGKRRRVRAGGGGGGGGGGGTAVAAASRLGRRHELLFNSPSLKQTAAACKAPVGAHARRPSRPALSAALSTAQAS